MFLGRKWKLRPLILLVSPLALCAAVQTAPPPQTKADLILIEKSARSMKLMRGDKILKTYKVSLSTVPVGAKEHEGDHKVPQGMYTVDAKNPHSRFHLALHVSYPNPADRERAKKEGRRAGGDIEMHGLGKEFAWVGGLQRQVDWTDGCIAVTNSEIEEIWPLVPVGTRVEILP